MNRQARQHRLDVINALRDATGLMLDRADSLARMAREMRKTGVRSSAPDRYDDQAIAWGEAAEIVGKIVEEKRREV